MPMRQFDGFVRVADSQKIEHADGSLETREYHRRVLSKETIKAGNALRSELTRTLGKIGLKIPPLGILVDTRGLESMKGLEKETRTRCEAIRELMVTDLIKKGESENLAVCDVDLIALRLLPEEEFAEGVEKLLAEALAENYDRENSRLAENLDDIIRAIECGHGLVAQRRLSAIGRFLTELSERNETAGDEFGQEQIEPLKTDLIQAKQIVAAPKTTVAEKIEHLKKLKLFDGITVRARIECISTTTVAAVAG